MQGYTSILVGEAIIRGSESQMAGSSYQVISAKKKTQARLGNYQASPAAAVERMCHIQDSQGQSVVLAFKAQAPTTF